VNSFTTVTEFINVLFNCVRRLTEPERTIISKWGRRNFVQVEEGSSYWKDWHRIARDNKRRNLSFLRLIITPSAPHSIPGLSISGSNVSVQDMRAFVSVTRSTREFHFFFHHARRLMASKWGIPVFYTKVVLIFSFSYDRASTIGPYLEPHEPRTQAPQFHI
jgi:hypothetical protein